jgi:hypothetical protein
MLVFMSYKWGCHCGRISFAGAAIKLYGASVSAREREKRTPTAIVMSVMGLWGWESFTGPES